SMPFMSVIATRIANLECQVSRSGYTGEDGFEISVAASDAEQLARLLLAQQGVAPAGLGARDSLRLEAGLCLYGHDLDETTTPIEAGLGWAIQKVRRRGGARAGGFPGAEVILDQLERGSERVRVGILPEGRAPIREGEELHDSSGRMVGRLTSGGFGATLDVPLAMGYVAREYAAAGTVLSATVRGKVRACRVCSLPFVPHRYYRGRSQVTALRMTEDHEWIRLESDGTATVGITQYAQEQLGDIVYVELPAVGRKLARGEEAAVIESVKAAAECKAPVSGTVLAVNAALADEPGKVNHEPTGAGWFFKLKPDDPKEIEGLMDEPTYLGKLAK
ncbi:MAG: glycine cleavage system protein GcvH, partial [Burkholderiales bacterium]